MRERVLPWKDALKPLDAVGFIGWCVFMCRVETGSDGAVFGNQNSFWFQVSEK